VTTDERVIVGEVVGAFGIKGEVKLTALLDSPQTLAKVSCVELRFPDGTRRERRVERVRVQQGAVIALFEGADRTEAESLRGVQVFLKKSDFPPLGPDAWYEWQLLGLAVRTESGKNLGKIEHVLYLPGNDVYETELAMIPAIGSVVVGVSLDAGEVVVRDVTGLLKSEV
jgi:16S rRNA processing protein RimM